MDKQIGSNLIRMTRWYSWCLFGQVGLRKVYHAKFSGGIDEKKLTRVIDAQPNREYSQGQPCNECSLIPYSQKESGRKGRIGQQSRIDIEPKLTIFVLRINNWGQKW
jgi:hypothetical protein